MSTAQAQSPDTTPRPAFEVISIHLSPEDLPIQNTLLTYPGGRVVCKGCWLEYLVMEAFHLPFNRIQGGPSWSKNARFDIEAKPPASSESAKAMPPDPKMHPEREERLMLQSLLIDRFHLTFHYDSKPGPIYELIQNGKPLQLKPPKTTDIMPWAGHILEGGQGLQGTNISIEELAYRMSDWLNRPVVDKTGIRGSFDFVARVDDGESSPGDDYWATLKPALHILGFDLRSAKSEVTTLVIDSAEKPLPN